MKSRTETFNTVASRLRLNFSFSNVISVFSEQMQYAKGHRGTKLSKLLLTLWVMIKESRNPWYYWYTGSRIVAIQAWIVSFLVMSLCALVTTGGMMQALIYVLIGIALESLAPGFGAYLASYRFLHSFSRCFIPLPHHSCFRFCFFCGHHKSCFSVCNISLKRHLVTRLGC